MKKFQTTVRPDGSTSVMQLGTVATTRLDDDMDFEKERSSKIALMSDRILTVEQTDTNVIVVYRDGTVHVIHWVAE